MATQKEGLTIFARADFTRFDSFARTKEARANAPGKHRQVASYEIIAMSLVLEARTFG